MKPTIYYRTSFLDALAQLPDSFQKKARKALKIFEREPTSNGLNFEKLEGAKDQKIFSIRVDGGYRIILARAPKEAIYMAFWVGNHDDSYKWAENRILTVHPQSGEIQIIETLETNAPFAEPPAPSPKLPEIDVPDIFEKFTDADLRQLGATDETLRLIRSIKDEPTLEKLERRFTEPVYDALLRLACGDSYDSVIEEVGIAAGKHYVTDDFKAALELDVNKQKFAVITDDSELERMLNEPLAHWRVFLHPSQRKLVDANFNGPARVLGGAGTGKTVVAMHRAKHLASQCTENELILFTTFTKSLVHDIKHNLQKICTYDEISRIKVVHLDAWCSNFLRSRNFFREVAYGEDDPLRKKLWKQSLDAAHAGEFTAEFLRAEWDKVIQYHDVTEFPGYAALPRPGRHGRLDRLQRKAIWPVFQKYRSLLDENQLWEPADMFRAARSILVNEGLEAGFKHIIVDEIQDFHPQAFRLLRAMIPEDRYPRNDLFLVGDGHQNIYGHHIILSQLGIDIRGRGRRLKLNYRTPEESRRWAVSILQNQEINDLDGGKDNYQGYHSSMSGPDPVFESFQTFEDEVKHIVAWHRRIRESSGTHVACVTVHTNEQRKQYAQALSREGCPVHEITGDSMDLDDPAPLRLATMHRIKGLEFDHVCLADCYPPRISSLPMDRQASQRCLLHVAATRTKNSLLIISSASFLK
jgi:superfamily I DNA/RNA helicase/mRNA-degrading endonuclease RelE of RelBE toxin-antitoxin system